MATTKKEGDAASAEPVYDVAISFLVSDEKTASEIKSGLFGLNVFFYPHNQEELIGTNGIESMREPFLKARVNVIVFRPRYGNTPWTGVELTAIQDSCLKTRYRSLVFVQLDKSDPKPDWLPDTHIRCILGDFTIDQVVGAIKLRAQEMGGRVEKASPVAVARRLQEEHLLRQDQAKFFRDHPFIDTARECVVALMDLIMEQAKKIGAETGLQLYCDYEPFSSAFHGVIRYGRVTLQVRWTQNYSNVIDDAALECTDYNGVVILHKERRMYLREPTPMSGKKYNPVLNAAHELRWIEKSKPQQVLCNDEVAERVIEQLLSLVDRLNKGEVPRIEH